jgi:mannose-6-phosphate isomerase-like protein (cupin superfamily)
VCSTVCPTPSARRASTTFYVIDGTMTLLVGDRWIDAPKSAFVLVPGGITHDFENRGSERAGVLNFSAPGTFEQHSGLSQWQLRRHRTKRSAPAAA